MPEIIHPSIEHRPMLHLQVWLSGYGQWSDHEVYVPIEDAILVEHPRGPRGKFTGADILNRTHKVILTLRDNQLEVYEQIKTILRTAKEVTT